MGTKNFIACLMADLSFDHLLGKIPVHHFLLLVGKVDEVSYSGGPMTGQSVFYRLFAGADTMKEMVNMNEGRVLSFFFPSLHPLIYLGFPT